MKICIKCGEAKPFGDFHKDASKSFGVSNACKVCRREIERGRYVPHPKPLMTEEEKKRTNQKWRNENRDIVRAISARWNANNRDVVNAAARKYTAKNRASLTAKTREKRRQNPHIPRAQSAAREAAKMQARPKWANLFILSEAYHLARIRTSLTGIMWHVDHVVPLRGKTVCGLHVEHNIQVIPASLNCSKNNRHWPDMPTQPTKKER